MSPDLQVPPAPDVRRDGEEWPSRRARARTRRRNQLRARHDARVERQKSARLPREEHLT